MVEIEKVSLQVVCKDVDYGGKQLAELAIDIDIV